MQQLLYVLMYSLISITFLFVISKLAGTKQIAQLNLIDFVLAISVGSIAAEMATDLSDTPFYLYLVAMTVFILFEIVVTFLERKGVLLKSIFKSKPITIIEEGKLNYKNLKKSKLDINEFIMLCRILGYFDLKNIAFAIFETNGQLSVLPKGDQKPVVVQDVGAEVQPSQLPTYLVTAGKISAAGMQQCGKTKEWLYKQLNISSKKELKKILLASYDQENNSVIVVKNNKETK